MFLFFFADQKGDRTPSMFYPGAATDIVDAIYII